jgi:hypothetical protein
MPQVTAIFLAVCSFSDLAAVITQSSIWVMGVRIKKTKRKERGLMRGSRFLVSVLFMLFDLGFSSFLDMGLWVPGLFRSNLGM